MCNNYRDKDLKRSDSWDSPGVRPHKEKINISKEIINKTRGAEAPYAAQIFIHLSVVSSRQRLYGRLRCEDEMFD